MSEQLYPKVRKSRRHKHFPWWVEYEAICDGGGTSQWDACYRTRAGAKLAAWWNIKVCSWGGTAILRETRFEASK